MLEHSKAKVELYRRYLALYLNILGGVRSVERIFIFDLLCGEGLYKDNSKGSPIMALEVIRDHYFSHNQLCPNISIWFNDNGISKIETGVTKIDRLRKLCVNIFKPNNVNIDFHQEEYQSIHTRALQTIRSANSSKGLFFIDPYGYKIIKPEEIRSILECKNTEVILFLPISHMYRFAETAARSAFTGSEPLYNFLVALFGGVNLRFKSVYDFIDQVRLKFREYLQDQNVFVDTFTLERDKQNVYCLFFFTSHIRGFEKMLEVKWNLDTEQGRGFRLEKSAPLFSGSELADYPGKLREFIQNAPHRTNEEIYRFGLGRIRKGWRIPCWEAPYAQRRFNRRPVGAAGATSAAPEAQNWANQQAASEGHERHLMGAPHGGALGRAAPALWQAQNGFQSLLSLAQGWHLGSDLCRPASPSGSGWGPGLDRPLRR